MELIESFLSWIWSWAVWIWHGVGELETPQATLITVAVSLITIWLPILKGRKTAREKNALDYELYCQNNEVFRAHALFVRKMMRAMLVDNKTNEEKRSQLLKRYIELPAKLNEIRKDSVDEEEAEKRSRKFQQDQEKFESIIYILNNWERCASAIRYGIYDECLIYNAQAGGVIMMYKSLSPFIEACRTRNNNERLFVNIEWLATRWEIKHTISGKVTRRARKTLEVIRVSRRRMSEHKGIRECYTKLRISRFWLWWRKKP